MPLDPQAAPIIELLEQFFPRITGPDTDAADVRAQADAMERVPPTEEIGSVVDRMIPGGAAKARPDGRVAEAEPTEKGSSHQLPIRVYEPLGDAPAPRPGVVYYHGGGWTICGLDTHENACRRIANETGSVVVSVDYRLAPEHKYPAAADDAYTALCWVAEHADELGIDRSRIAVAGDSAGGNLGASVALRARDEGPPVAFQLLVYPVIDSSSTRNDYPSKTDNATGYFLTTAQMEWYRLQYLPDDDAGEHPWVSPNLALSHAGLPPTCIVTAEMDPLRDEAEEYARQLEAAGVPVTVYRATGMFHGFFSMDAVLQGAKDAQVVAFDAMRRHLGDA